MIIVSSFVLNVDHRHRDHRHRDHRYRDNYFNVSNCWNVWWMYLSERLELCKVGKGSRGYLLKSACCTGETLESWSLKGKRNQKTGVKFLIVKHFPNVDSKPPGQSYCIKVRKINKWQEISVN